MTAGTHPLLRFLPWLLASAVVHAVLLVQWPTSGDTAAGNTADSDQAGALQIQLLRNIAPALQPTAGNPTTAATTPALVHATPKPRTRSSAAAPTMAAQRKAAVDTGSPHAVASTAAAPAPSAPSVTDASPDHIDAAAHNDTAAGNAGWTELMALLHQAIDRNKRYPQSALRMGREGSARIDFRLGPDGRIEDLNIGNSSGVHALDVAAYRAVQGIAPFPEAHRYLDRAQRFQVDVVFRIN